MRPTARRDRSRDGFPDVLIVDPNASTRAFLRVALLMDLDGRVGEIREAADGEQALRACRRFRPDVVLIECSLRDVTPGLAARLLRARLPGLRVVAYARKRRMPPRWADRFATRAELFGARSLASLVPALPA